MSILPFIFMKFSNACFIAGSDLEKSFENFFGLGKIVKHLYFSEILLILISSVDTIISETNFDFFA